MISKFAIRLLLLYTHTHTNKYLASFLVIQSLNHDHTNQLFDISIQSINPSIDQQQQKRRIS